MQITQSIETPFGVNVFGSAVLRVAPDVATLNFSVSRLGQHPQESFQAVRDAAKQVQNYLVGAQITDAGTSRVTLEEAFHYQKGENKFIGYRAKVAFVVLLYDLDRTEEILSGVIDAGADKIGEVEFQTSRLRELRLEVRQRAIVSAREKAEVYCKAAGVELGQVVHIEDVNPDQLGRNQGHVRYETELEDDGKLQAFDPGSIVVSGAVMVAFKIRNASEG